MNIILNDLSIDSQARTVHRHGANIKLPDLSFDVLLRLIQSAPEAVSTQQLCSDVWRTAQVSDETIAQRITLLRKALNDDPKNPTYIRTVRGAGYRIVASVTKQAPANTQDKTLNKQLSPWALPIVAVCFLLAGVVFFQVAQFPAGENTQGSPSAQVSEVDTLIQRAKAQLHLHQARETDRAISMLREALKQEPNNQDARLSLSFALSTKATKFGGDMSHSKEAEAIARALIQELPQSSNAWSALAYSLDSQGRSDEGLPAYQYAYQLNPLNAPAMSSAAYVHLLRGELFQALSLEMRAQKAGGKSRYAEIQIAQSLELINHPATPKWQSYALNLNPGQVVVVGETARSYIRQGDPDAALQVLTQINGEDQYAPSIIQLKGRIAIIKGNYQKAQTLMATPEPDAYPENIALSALMGDKQQAQALLASQRLKEIATNTSPETSIYIAEVAAAMGNKKLALEMLSQGVRLGWRDIPWLVNSPFLGELMASEQADAIKARVSQELDAQRRLIEGSEELSSYINR